MNKLMQTTALAALLALSGTAYADNHSTSSDAANSNKQEVTDQNKTGDAMNAGNEDSNMAAKDSREAMGKDMKQKRDGAALFIIYADSEKRGDIRASNLIGMRVYAVEQDVDESANYNADARKEWEDIGEINDVIVGWNGEIQGVILGVGGFLGLGEKNVAVDMSSLRRVRESDDSDDWFLVVNSSKTALEQAPAYKPAS